MKRPMSWVLRLGLVSAVALTLQPSDVIAQGFQRAQIQPPPKSATPGYTPAQFQRAQVQAPPKAAMPGAQEVTPASDAFDCLMCWTCGGPAPYISGIVNSPGGTWEWGPGCSGPPQWTNDQWPRLCCHD